MEEDKAVISHLTPEKDKQSHDEKEEVEKNIFAKQSKTKYSEKVADSEFDKVFADNKIDVDMESEYKENNMIEEEEIIELTRESKLDFARGVDYDQMNDLIASLKKDNHTEEEITVAADTIKQINNTEIFQMLLKKIGSEAPSRVEAIFAKNEEMIQHRSGSFDLPDRYEDFDIKSIF